GFAVKGFTDSNHSPEAGSVHFPPINIWCFVTLRVLRLKGGHHPLFQVVRSYVLSGARSGRPSGSARESDPAWPGSRHRVFFARRSHRADARSARSPARGDKRP